MNFHEEIKRTVSDLDVTLRYMKDRYGTNQRHWWAVAHRARLLSSGEYIKTTERDQELMDKAMEATREIHAKWVGETVPELVNFRPHHKGTAIGMDDEHWPGCGCA